MGLKWLKRGWLFGLIAACSLGCSDDGAGAADPKDCDAVMKRLNSLSVDAGCGGQERTDCAQVYSSKQCVNEWEAAVTCVTAKSGSDFTCDSSNRLVPKTGVCTSQIAALDRCFGDD